MERIHSHLLWAGVAAHEIGFDTVFNITWRAREEIMDMIEFVFGHRVTKAIIQVGGVRRDITSEHIARIQQGLDFYRSVFAQLQRIFLEDETVKMRCRNVGILNREDALELLAVGPLARASGVAKDVRQDQPYAAYADIGVSAVMPDAVTGCITGDVYDRIIVRLLEIPQSIDIIEKCLRRLPEGPILAETKMPRLLKHLTDAAGEGIGRVEAPRGEDIHYVRLESGRTPLAAWHVRAPTYINLVAVPTILKGLQIADVPIAFASIDPCMSCTNRLSLTDRATGRKSVVTYEEMHRLSVEKTRRLRGC
jgi:membrane-bound hydrogenase subunit alpha